MGINVYSRGVELEVEAGFLATLRTWQTPWSAWISCTASPICPAAASSITRLVSASIDYVFSNTLSWVNLVQYDNVSETLGVNMRLQWIPQAGQEYFFVVNHNMEDLDRDNRFHSAVSTITAKFSYTFRY